MSSSPTTTFWRPKENLLHSRLLSLVTLFRLLLCYLFVSYLVLQFTCCTHRAYRDWRDNKKTNIYDTIRYDIVCITCSKKLTGSQLSLPHGTNKKIKCKTKNKTMSVIGLCPVQSRYREAVQQVKGKRKFIRDKTGIAVKYQLNLMFQTVYFYSIHLM